jgi:enoyl-CoA hydratase/3-hydroxyacyl-CoA dehydrogenase
MSEPKRYESVIVKKEEGIGWMTLNRPHRLNTLTGEMMDEMHSVLNDFEADKEVKCIVITGAGEKAFSAGADVTAFQGATPATAVEASSKGQAVITRLEKIEIGRAHV